MAEAGGGTGGGSRVVVAGFIVSFETDTKVFGLVNSGIDEGTSGALVSAAELLGEILVEIGEELEPSLLLAEPSAVLESEELPVPSNLELNGAPVADACLEVPPSEDNDWEEATGKSVACLVLATGSAVGIVTVVA